MKKKRIIIAAIIGAAAITTFSIICFAKSNSETASETVVKETTVQKGTITTGVTESGSVEVGSLTQTYALYLTTVNLSASSSGSSGSSSAGAGSSGSSGTSGSAGTSGNTGSSMGSSSSSSGAGGSTGQSPSGTSASSSSTTGTTSQTTTSSSASTNEITDLVVESVSITAGQSVKKGDPIMTLTADSVSSVRAELETAVSNAKLALKNADIEDAATKLSAESTYNTTIAAGEVAESVYNATLQSLDNNIASLQSQISSTSDSTQAASLTSQLTQAQSEYETKRLSAKQTYDETMLNYENADQVYQIAISQVGDAAETAQETLDSASENLTAFDALIKDNAILAAYSGTILSAPYTAGDTLSSTNALAEYKNDESVTLSVSVTQDDIGAVNIGDSVNIDFIAFEDEAYTGTVKAIESAVTTSSAVSYPVTITLTTMPEKTLTGMTANVTFITKEVKDVLYVSNKAVITDGTTSYVKVKDNSGNTQQKEVTTGFSDGINVEIQSGLKEGDTALIESKVTS